MKKLKGIISFILSISVIFLMIPFNIYADTQIVPTLSSSAQSWVNQNGQIYVTNYCEGTTAATNSCKLTFTTPSNFYGMIYFDGYNSNNTKVLNYVTVFIADGVGEYNYNLWQSGQVSISKVTINTVNLVRPNTTVDLSQIIQLLTAIDQDTSSIDLTLDNTLTQITNVLNQLIISNGYLETISKYRQFNFPIESFSAISTAMGTLPIVDYFQYYSYIYPIFSITQNDILFNINVSPDGDVYLVYFLSGRITTDTMSRYLEWSEGYSIKEYSFIRSGTYNGRNGTFYRVVISWDSGGFKTLKFIGTATYDFIPIYAYGDNGYVSTDFALLWGLNNRLLDDINLIAQGSAASSSAASDLEDSNNQMASDMNDLATIESGYNQQFNNSLQTIDFSNPVQSNQGMLPAANFVITIFNGLITNNPFSVLIIIVCILLIGKKVIGK